MMIGDAFVVGLRFVRKPSSIGIVGVATTTRAGRVPSGVPGIIVELAGWKDGAAPQPPKGSVLISC